MPITSIAEAMLFSTFVPSSQLYLVVKASILMIEGTVGKETVLKKDYDDSIRRLNTFKCYLDVTKQ